MHLVCFSHLRWDYVYQRPQHLLSRFAQLTSVWFWEEPIYAGDRIHLSIRRGHDGLNICTPELPHNVEHDFAWKAQRRLLEEQLAKTAISEYLFWYYTPMAMNFTSHLEPQAIVYDCMDELSAFRGAPPGLRAAERELFDRADLVFTGGKSLYEAKRRQHRSVHEFPSSIDATHFKQARASQTDPADQQTIPHPRIGFAGVIDERLDTELLAAASEIAPDWHFVMIGPVAKIADSDLPKNSNIHYLGQKPYSELPAYFAGWDLGMLPFARNEATRYISPTKTPEYLAAGLPVVSTAIADVVHAYGSTGLLEIANAPGEFVAACKRVLNFKHDPAWLSKVDAILSQGSWDVTWRKMLVLIEEVLESKLAAGTRKRQTQRETTIGNSTGCRRIPAWLGN